MKNVNIIVPQYHSSHCADNCKYCGFKKTNKFIQRERLGFDEYKKELEILINWGYKTIEFVYASDGYFTPDKIAKRVEYAKNISEQRKLNLHIGLNSQPFDFKGYKTLNNAGLDFFVLWMETYDKEKYFFWHGNKTKKSDYEFRYNAFERAINAGITNYGLGVLFGLYDWKKDVLSLIEHGNQLNKKYGYSPYIIGLPRIKRANSVDLIKDYSMVNDLEYKKAIKMYNNAFPDAMLFYNTRETFDLNIKTCSENDLFTIDCGTFPGAYLTPSILQGDNEQFHTQQYVRDNVIKELRNNGLNPKFEW